jgi:multisubunit Na+/H+ antiporter MnhB subunit
MERRVLIMLLVTGLIVLALAGWTLQGARWLTAGGRRPTLPQPA